MKYELIKQEGRAKRARVTTVHGVIETPVFMNVATAGAIKGGLSAGDLRSIDTQVALCNTYHLHVRPGDDLVYRMGGLHKFMKWDRPILTDSGGFQVFSLSDLRSIKEEGVTFRSHVDGRKIFMGPEESMRIQSHLGSTIAMAFDECAPALADREYVARSVDRTTRWLERCKTEMKRLNSLETTVNREQLLFGINQGAVYPDIRIDHAGRISEMDLDGYAVGGLAVGETHEQTAPLQIFWRQSTAASIFSIVSIPAGTAATEIFIPKREPSTSRAPAMPKIPVPLRRAADARSAGEDIPAHTCGISIKRRRHSASAWASCITSIIIIT